MFTRASRQNDSNYRLASLRRPPRLLSLEGRATPDVSPHGIAVSHFYQNWNAGNLIIANDDWSGVLSIVGYLGDDTFGEGVDPQTVVTPYSTVDVIANQGSNTALTAGGVAEFDGLALGNHVIALQGDGTADAPNLVVAINTTGRANISISYSLRDIDGTAENAIQPVALQYRVGNAGDFVNVPGGFVSDATSGPSVAGKVTPVNVTLPGAVDNQSLVQVRMITTNAVGNDEWVGVEDIVVGSNEFAINTYTTLLQRASSVAVDADGDAFVTWYSNGQDGSGDGIYGQRFDAAGMKVGGEFQVHTYTTNNQRNPRVALDADGDAFVVWQNNYGIYGQRFDAAGMKVGVEFLVNTHTTIGQARPSVAVDADGDAFVTWQSASGDGGSYGVYGQRFDAAGMKVGVEFQVNSYTTNNQVNSSVAVDADGDAFVTWRSGGQDGSGYGIYGQRFDAAGMKVGVEFQVNTYTTNDQSLSSVAVDADGDAVVVWGSNGQDGSNYGVYAQRFNSAGMKVGGEVQVNTYTTTIQRSPSVAVDADGDAFVTWQSYGQDGSAFGIYGQRFDAAGMKVGGEFRVNIYTTSHQTTPSVAVDADGDAFVTWQSGGQDGNSDGIYGQRFRSPPAAKVSNIQVNDSSPQRSVVTSLKIAFNSPVSFVGNPAAAFFLARQTGGNAFLSATVDVSGTAVTLTFTGGSVDLGGSLSDGRYTLTILGGQFTGNGLDGNGDGIPGDNYVLVGTPANGLFRLFGDADGDGDVDAGDFGAFRGAFGGVTNLAFDFDGDGDIDAADFGQFRPRFGTSI